MTNHYALKVLLVDDEPKVIDTLIYALRNRPYHLRSASSGKEALAKFADEAADILVTDIKMPGMNGLELINKVLAKDRRRNKITFFSPVRVCQIAIDFSGRSENKSRIRDMT